MLDVLSEEDWQYFIKTSIQDGVTRLHDERNIENGIHRITPAFAELLPDMTWYTYLHDMSPYTIDQSLLDVARTALETGTCEYLILNDCSVFLAYSVLILGDGPVDLNLADVQRFENPNRNTRHGVLKGCPEDAPSVLQDVDLNLKATRPAQNRTSCEWSCPESSVT